MLFLFSVVQIFEVNMYHPPFVGRQPRHWSITFKSGSIRHLSWNATLVYFILNPLLVVQLMWLFAKLLTHSQIAVFVWTSPESGSWQKSPTSRCWRARSPRWDLRRAWGPPRRACGRARLGPGGKGRLRRSRRLVGPQQACPRGGSAPQGRLGLPSVSVVRGEPAAASSGLGERKGPARSPPGAPVLSSGGRVPEGGELGARNAAPPGALPLSRQGAAGLRHKEPPPQVEPGVDPRRWRLLCPWKVPLPILSTVGAVFKDAALPEEHAQWRPSGWCT